MKKIIVFFLFLVSLLTFGQTQTKSIGFIENKGQIVDQKGRKNNAVQYLLNTNGLNIQLRKNGFSYDVYETKKHPLSKKEKAKLYPTSFGKEDTLKNPNYTLEYSYHRIDIDFENCNKNLQFVSKDKSTDYDNYYNVPSEPNGILDVHKYQKITYQNVYPNIDVVFSIPEDKTKPVEYNFVIKPNGKISDIQLKFKGVSTELVNNKIKMDVRFGAMEEIVPSSWIENESEKKEITINYRQIKKNVFGFESSENLSNKTVVIDPTPVRLWGTYYAGNNGDYSTDICNDNQNNVYFSGYTGSSTNIATMGSQITNVNFYNIIGFISKFNSNGQRIWGIYYSARPLTIKVDSNLNLYFSGNTSNEPNVSSLGSHQPNQGDYGDAFLVKLNPMGVRDWGTYYGGDKRDEALDICFDSQNNVYLTGSTESNENIGTIGTHQSNLSNGSSNTDGFIVKFSSSGTRIWGTYFGGTNTDLINSAHISNDGYLYLTGNTSSTNGISTLGSYQTSYSGLISSFISKFDTNGQRIWGTYINGNNFLVSHGSKLKDNFIYFFGDTKTSTVLNSSGTFNPNPVDLNLYFGRTSYVIKFDINTQNQVWGTYFGEFIQDIDVNSNNEVFIEGCTWLTSGISTPGAYKEVPQYSDAYLIKLNQNGQRIWGTYYGGNVTEGSNGAVNVNNKMSIDNNNNIYLVGNTDSFIGISTPGAHQENFMYNSLGGIYNIYLAKLQDCLSSPLASSNSPICIGEKLNLTASGGTSYSWTEPNGFTSNLQNPIISNANATNAGQYICTISGTGGCDGDNTINVLIGDTVKPVPNKTTLSTITGDCNTTIPVPTATDNCAGVINGTTTDPVTFTIPGSYTINWNYNDGNGNSETQIQNVTITAVALPSLLLNENFCIQQNATLNSITITGQNIKWYDLQTGGVLLPNSTLLINGTTYYASQTVNGCESLRSPITIKIQNTSAPTAVLSQTFCATQNPTLSDVIINGTSVIWYNSNTSTTPISNNTNLTNGTIYYATQTLNSCESVNRIAVTTTLINTLNATNYSETICDTNNDVSEMLTLTNYNSNLISNTANCTFEYYDSFNAATNQISSGLISANYKLSSLGISRVYVRIKSNNGCFQIVYLEFTLVNKPIISINNTMPICQGSFINVNAGSGFDSYIWSTGITGQQSIQISQAGNYSVSVSKNYGSVTCSSTKNFTVVNSNLATVSQIITTDWDYNTILVQLSTSSSGNYQYSIDGINYQESNYFENLESGQYTVFIKDLNGCGITTDEVYLLSYPKYFTPNGDGYNDYWKINFSQFEPNLTIKIFDRFGKLLKMLSSNSNGWDGTYNGSQMPSDDYWFDVTRENGKVYKGHFSLKR